MILAVFAVLTGHSNIESWAYISHPVFELVKRVNIFIWLRKKICGHSTDAEVMGF